ncbi:MAG: hypothetical protein JWO80_6111 [Bryobacterales bacterium]|nr:hypothetical protein [Bryobacterales bacterium]
MATAALDWSQCPAVESIPGKVSGAWVFKDTRMPVSTVFENLESGASIEEIMEWFDLTREQIVAVLEFAARSLDAPPPAKPLVDIPRCSFSLITVRPCRLYRSLKDTQSRRRRMPVGTSWRMAITPPACVR